MSRFFSILFSIVLVFSVSAQMVSSSTETTNHFNQFLAAKNIPSYESCLPRFYFSGEAWNKRALELVASAKHYILIDSFLVNAHPVNQEIIDALREKAESGVGVYIIFDSSSYFTYMPDFVSYLPTPVKFFKGTRVNVAEYNPINGTKLFALPQLLNRDHRKFWIIDGHTVALGGMNLNYYSMKESSKLGNIDTFVEIQSPIAISQLIQSFVETWNLCSPISLNAKYFTRDKGSETDYSAETRLWLFDQDLHGRSEVNALFDSFFNSAQREIWMIQGYTFATPELLSKIKNATSRGVAVNILLSTNSFREVYELASNYCILDLIRAGANVFIFDDPGKAFLHYKLLLADRSIAAFGSPNFNFRSQYLSREIAILFNDERVGRKAFENLETLLINSRPVYQDEAEKYRGFKYFLAYMEMLLGG